MNKFKTHKPSVHRNLLCRFECREDITDLTNAYLKYTYLGSLSLFLEFHTVDHLYSDQTDNRGSYYAHVYINSSNPICDRLTIHVSKNSGSYHKNISEALNKQGKKNISTWGSVTLPELIETIRTTAHNDRLLNGKIDTEYRLTRILEAV